MGGILSIISDNSYYRVITIFSQKIVSQKSIITALQKINPERRINATFLYNLKH